MTTTTEQTPNPYAPPITDEAPPRTAAGPVNLEDPAIDEALRRLNEHVADPANLEQDARTAGPRVNTTTLVLLVLVLGLGGLAVVGLLFLERDSALTALVPLAIVLLVLFLIIFVVSLVNVLSVIPRRRATEPLAALRGVWRAIKLGSPGYLIASLCPTAREQTLARPELERYPTGKEGSFSMGDKRQVRDYLRRWAASGAGQVRWLTVPKMKVIELGDNVAVVRSELKLQALPQWANILSIVLFLFIRLVGLVVALVLYFSLRKKHVTTVDKVMLRGQNGLWYLYSASLDR
jgi:hypothetical protein